MQEQALRWAPAFARATLRRDFPRCELVSTAESRFISGIRYNSSEIRLNVSGIIASSHRPVEPQRMPLDRRGAQAPRDDSVAAGRVRSLAAGIEHPFFHAGFFKCKLAKAILRGERALAKAMNAGGFRKRSSGFRCNASSARPRYSVLK